MIRTRKPIKQFLTHVFYAFLVAVTVVVSPAQALPTKNAGYDSANNILFYDPDVAECDATSSKAVGELSGEDNLQKIYYYMMKQGLTDVQAAGVIGNISQESGGNPKVIQGGGETDDPSNISSGWGLIQWTPGSKVIGIAKQAGVTGDISTLETQLLIIWWHMTETSPTGVKNFIEEYKGTTDVKQATLLYEQKMEGAGDPQMSNRYTAAQLALDTYPKTGGTSTDTTSGCTCTTGPTDEETTGTVDVLLDPGHSGVNKQGKEVDPATKLYIGDSNNTPEKDQMFEAASKVKDILEAKGYVVQMTKDSANDYVNLADRAKMANEVQPQIAVSLHNTPGKFGDAKVGWVSPQELGLYRTGTNGKKTTFSLNDIANKSQDYASKIVAARKKAEGGAKIHGMNFDNRPGLSPGNISVVQLLSQVPWVYNEVGQSGFNATKYAEGIANGIMDSIKPLSGDGEDTDPNCSGAAAGDVAQTAMNYAYPEYHKPNYCTPTKAYAEAVTKAIAAGKYVGGTCMIGGTHPGIDCGGFVTRVIQDSGADPEYNNAKGPTTTQLQYLLGSDKWQKIEPTSTADLEKYEFAVAVNSVHTYLYIGKHDGFETAIASASYSPSNTAWRAPMAGHEMPGDTSYSWFVLK